MVSALAFGLALNLLVGSRLEHRAAQARAYDTFRQELALGTAPLRPTSDHRALALGTPMALLEIPSIGVKEVVGEGTTGTVLMSGPGHLRSSVFPGEVGTSVILGRAAAYGGPFGRLHDLRKGAHITVITQGGTSTFTVVDTRTAHALIPVLAPGQARLTLATATGPAFVPSGVVWVDANDTATPFAAAPPPLVRVPPDERPLGVDTAPLGSFLLWLALLALVLAGALWTWRHRGHAQAWVTFLAPVVLVAYFAATHGSAMLPNLL
jgi:LPXTG-site transpeptidase (sortase) family protein